MYGHHKPAEVRQQIALSCVGLVKFVVRRFNASASNSTVALAYSDLFQIGMIGLLDAIDRFDPSRGVKFETYAVTRIRGTVQDELRKLDWIPRSVREKVRVADRLMQKFECSKSPVRALKDSESGTSISAHEYRRLMEEAEVAMQGTFVQCHDGEERVDAFLPDTPMNPLQHAESNEIRKVLTRLIHELPKQERIIIALYYYEELTFKEIATLLHLSESRIFQKHSAILAKLRSKVEELS